MAFSKLLSAPFGVLQRRFIRAPARCPAESAAMDMRPPSSTFIESTEAIPLRAQKIFGGDDAVFEDQFSGITGAPALACFPSCPARKSPWCLYRRTKAERPWVWRGLVRHRDYGRRHPP